MNEHFWEKVDRSGGPDSCWPFLGYLNPKSYGRYRELGGRTTQAHRYAYEALVGPIPEGLTLDHLCRTRACVNPAHLDPVTNRENVLRGVGLSAQNARKDRCRNGHLFDETNTRIRGTGDRQCKTCERANNNRSYDKRVRQPRLAATSREGEG